MVQLVDLMHIDVITFVLMYLKKNFNQESSFIRENKIQTKIFIFRLMIILYSVELEPIANQEVNEENFIV
jgi:hypothetical protein